jgi:hypothetical protein
LHRLNGAKFEMEIAEHLESHIIYELFRLAPL